MTGYVPLMSNQCHACDSFSQAFPLEFCILQVNTNLRREWPGNEAVFTTAELGEIATKYASVDVPVERAVGQVLNSS